MPHPIRLLSSTQASQNKTSRGKQKSVELFWSWLVSIRGIDHLLYLGHYRVLDQLWFSIEFTLSFFFFINIYLIFHSTYIYYRSLQQPSVRNITFCYLLIYLSIIKVIIFWTSYCRLVIESNYCKKKKTHHLDDSLLIHVWILQVNSECIKKYISNKIYSKFNELKNYISVFYIRSVFIIYTNEF